MSLSVASWLRTGGQQEEDPKANLKMGAHVSFNDRRESGGQRLRRRSAVAIQISPESVARFFLPFFALDLENGRFWEI